jgi:hypothetical protein
MQEPLTQTEELSAVILGMLRQDCAQNSYRDKLEVGPPAPMNARSSHLSKAGMWNWAQAIVSNHRQNIRYFSDRALLS